MSSPAENVMIAPGPKNAWRLAETLKPDWEGRLDPDGPDKFLIVSTDNHVNEPIEVFDAIEPKYKDRTPHIRTDDDGTQWLISEGWVPQPIRISEQRADLMPPLEDFEVETWDLTTPFSNRMEDQDLFRSRRGRGLAQRIADRESQGIDAELVFSTRGLLAFATPDIEFSLAMARTWNRWALDTFKADFDRAMPMALLPVADVDAAIAEMQWAAANGFHGVMIPNRPCFNRIDEPRNPLDYNNKMFDPLWSAIEEADIPMTLHVSTGQDPRAVKGQGGALINYTSHALPTPQEPVVQMIASGVFEQHPGLKLATIEGGIGWIPFVLNQMDHAYRAHHMWMRPIIPDLPSEYFKRNCYAAMMEEHESFDLCLALGLEDNMFWASDYPHPEGNFPHCRESINRVIGNASEDQAAKVLGLNAAKVFKIDPAIKGKRPPLGK